jgi:hypothetical protein
MKRWFMDSNFHKQDHMVRYLDAALSYVFLHKFGGTVLSFDLLLRKSIAPMGEFLARCAEDEVVPYPVTLNSRHEFLENLLTEFGNNFDPGRADSMAASFLTDRLKKLCKVAFVNELQYKECKKGAKVLPADWFCPVAEDKSWMIYDPVRAKLVLKTLEEAGSYGLRLWSDATGEYDNWGAANFTTAFYRLAEERCPLIVQSLGQRHF